MSEQLPRCSDMEKPLLRIIITKFNGSLDFQMQGRELEILMAKEFNLSNEAVEYSAPNYNSEGHRQWRNRLQSVRSHLVNLGQIDPSERNIWKITQAGYDRVALGLNLVH
jgi:hypothetical protein